MLEGKFDPMRMRVPVVDDELTHDAAEGCASRMLVKELQAHNIDVLQAFSAADDMALGTSDAAAVTLVEKMPLEDTLYFAIVTGLTIGYGDIVVKTHFGRLVAILIGFIGILFTGLMAAVFVLAVRNSYEEANNIA